MLENKRELEETQGYRYAPPKTDEQETALTTTDGATIGPAETEALLEIARKEAESYRSLRLATRRTQRLFGGLFCILSAMWIIGLLFGRGGGISIFPFIILIASMGGAAMSQSYKAAAGKLAQVNDVRAVGMLAEALGSGDRDLTAVARKALRRLLPQMQFSDAPLLTAEQRDILNRFLPQVVTREDRAFSLAILKAYEQVGDEKSIVVVEKLTNSPVAQFDSELRQAAIDCLPYLRDSVARRRESQVLLRASHSEEARPETLLRPASAAPTNDDAQKLLRPVGEQAEDTRDKG